MKPASTRQPVWPPKHFQYDTAPIESAFSPLTSVSSTIAEARALVSRAESGLPIRRPPPSLHNPTRPETPAVHRRSSAFSRSASSLSASRSSLSLTSLSPLHTPLSSRPVSVDRWTGRGRLGGEDAEDGDELAGSSEWEEVRPNTAAVAGREALLVCREEEIEQAEAASERGDEERKEQLVESAKDDTAEADRDTRSTDVEWKKRAADAKQTSISREEVDDEVDKRAEVEHREAESDKEESVNWHKPTLSYVETHKTDLSVTDVERDVAQQEREEKEQAQTAFDQPSTTPAAAPDATPLSARAAPSPRQLDETLISLVYIASKLHDEPTSLSDSQLDHIYSLASSCLAHLTSPSSITRLAAAFLPLRPASAHHLALHCPLIVSVLSSLFALSRQPEHDELLCPLLPLLLLPPAVLPSKQTLMCLFSLLVNATMTDEGAAAVACTEWMVWLLQRTEDELSQPAHGGHMDALLEEKRVTVCVEVTAIMRNLACAPQAHRLFIEPLPSSLLSAQPSLLASTLSPRSPPTALDRLCLLLLRFPSHASLALNVLRILSKLSLHAACRAVLDRQVEAMEAMVGMLQSFHGKLALCVRVCFTLGNLTMTNADNRFVVADAVINTASGATTDGLSVLLSLLTRTHQRNRKLLALITESSANPSSSAAAPSSSKHRLMLRENVDLLVKLIRLMANLAIHHDAGRRLVEDDRAAVLVDVLRDANERKESAQHANDAMEEAVDRDETQPSMASLVDDEKTEELILNAISCMTNLSYYYIPQLNTTTSSTCAPSTPTSPSFLCRPLTAILPVLTPHLLSPSPETLTSLLRWLANVSRDGAARQLLYGSGVDEAVLVLLAHCDGDVVEVCAGVLLNCSADERWADERLAAEPANLLRLVDAADGDEDEGGEDAAEADEADEPQQGEAAVDGAGSVALTGHQSAEDEMRKWRVRGLIGKALCNMRRQQQRLELDDEVIERIESSVNEWTMELSDKAAAEERGDEMDAGRAAGRQASAALDEAELLSVFDTVLTSCSR